MGDVKGLEGLAEKFAELRNLVARLANDLGDALLEIADSWEEDLIATGLRNARDPNSRIYVALIMDHRIGEIVAGPNRYYFECEVPSVDESYPYDVAERGDHVNYEALREAVKRCLHL